MALMPGTRGGLHRRAGGRGTMRDQFFDGITSFDCPRCGRRLRDYDTPEPWRGLLRVTARCRNCHTEHRLEIDRGRSETRVTAIRSTAWVEALR